MPTAVAFAGPALHLPCMSAATRLCRVALGFAVAVATGAAAPAAWTLGAATQAAALTETGVPGLRAAGTGFAPAPTPNLDLSFDPNASRSSEAQLAPSIFQPRSFYRGEGYVPGSSASGQQTHKFKPTPGINLLVPLQ